MDDKDKQKVSLAKCNFCNRNQSFVKKLIAGPGGIYICDNCIELAHSIIFTEKQEESKDVSGPAFLKPREIKKALDDYIIGQDSAKKRFPWLFTTTIREFSIKTGSMTSS